MSRYVTGVRARSRIITTSSSRLLRSPRDAPSSPVTRGRGCATAFGLSLAFGGLATAFIFPLIGLAVATAIVIRDPRTFWKEETMSVRWMRTGKIRDSKVMEAVAWGKEVCGYVEKKHNTPKIHQWVDAF